MLRLENDHALRGADSGSGHIKLAVGNTVTPHIQASHFQTALCFIDGQGIGDLYRELYLLN